MNALLSVLIGLCLLRRGPQDLPYSPALTRNLVLLGFAVGGLIPSPIEGGDGNREFLLGGERDA